MKSTKTVGAQVVSTTQADDPLQTKYYCQVDKPQDMRVVMELSASGQQNRIRIPLRYVLVIDVSGSMQQAVGSDPTPLLERVKIFAELVVQKISEQDSLGIVAFSTYAQTVLEMTPMTSPNKELAKQTLKSLYPDASTNLESGLMQALECIASSRSNRPTRNCIILFTDGAANEGIVDPFTLIAQYRTKQSKISQSACIPVSAFTIGGYRPDLLLKISRELGSESFYWLNDEQDFEADMLIPLFLREMTYVSDVDVKLQTLWNVYFDPVRTTTHHLQSIGKHKVKIKVKDKKKKVKQPTQLRYFIHSLPDDNIKHLHLRIVLPADKLEQLDEAQVLTIDISYLDAQLQPRRVFDYIELHTKSILQARNQDPNATNTLTSDFMGKVSAFTMQQNQLGTSWMQAQEVLLRVAEEECKSISVAKMEAAKEYAAQNPAQAHACFQQARQEISHIKNRTMTLLGDSNQGTAKLDYMVSEWTTRIDFANDIVATQDERNFSRLSSMVSSIETESPTGAGVFKGKQPFMPSIIEEKLERDKKIVETTKQIQASGNYDVRDVAKRLQMATATGDLMKMQELQKVLQSLAFIGHDLDEEYLKRVESEIEHRIQLLAVREKLLDAEEKENISELEKAVTEMENLLGMLNLTHTVEDSKAMDRGKRSLDLLKKKRSLRAEIMSLKPNLHLPIVPRNMVKISQSIERLVRLKNQAKGMDDIWTEDDNTLLNTTISKVAMAKAKMEALKRRIAAVQPGLFLHPVPSNFEKIKQAVADFQQIKDEAEQFEGLFGDQEERVLEDASTNLEQLENLREEIRKEILDLSPYLALPMLPENYKHISGAVNKMLATKEKATGFNGVFMKEHQELFEQGKSNAETLRRKIEEISMKITKAIPDVGLPMFPANLDSIKTGVEKMVEAREEAKGFDGVFKEEEDVLLEKGMASVQILENKKTEVRQGLEESVDKMQLAMLPINYENICMGIEMFKGVAADAKDFGLYQEEYDAILEKAIFHSDVLRDKKAEIIKQLSNIKADLSVLMVPNNLKTLQVAVESMKALKESATGFDGVFTNQDEAALSDAMNNLEQLTKKVDKTMEARAHLAQAVEDRDFIKLDYAIKRARRAPFIEREELKEPQRLAAFLNPKNRRSAVKNGIREEDIGMIEEALLDMNEAKVNDDELVKKANRVLVKLRKREKRKEKERRRKEREEARRKKEIKRLTEKLSAAIENRDIEELEGALQDLDNSKIKEEEISIAKEAQELLEHLKIEEMKRRLQEAIRRRNLELLLDAVIDVDFSGYVQHMSEEYEEAKKLLLYLREMMRLRDEIAKMSRSAITEVHSYGKPPVAIKKVMKAIFIILGEPPNKLKDWAYIQSLLGKLDRNSITKRVKRFEIEDASMEVAQSAKKYLNDMNLDEMYGVSKPAATFYAWSRYVVNEVEHAEEIRNIEKEKLEKLEEESENSYDKENFDSETTSAITDDIINGVTRENDVNGTDDEHSIDDVRREEAAIEADDEADDVTNWASKTKSGDVVISQRENSETQEYHSELPTPENESDDQEK